MVFIVLDENDKLIVQYDPKQIRELLIKYTEILKDVGKAFDQLSNDLLEKARNK